MSKVIIGTGSDLPERLVTNDDLEATVDDYDRMRSGSSLHDWVMKRTGVALRHRVAEGEGTSDMAVRAARRALDDAGVAPEELDLIVCSTFTSDYRLPSTTSLVQAQLKTRAKCFQLEAACAGFIDGMITAGALLDALGGRTALVIHTEAVSALMDPRRFLEQTIFGDGAGAVVIREVPGSPFGVKAHCTYTDGSIAHWTWVPGGGTKAPITEQVLADRSQYLRMQSKDIYRLAVTKFAEMSREVVALAGCTLDDVAWFIPHQTGLNIIEDAAKLLGVGMDRFQICIDHTGNASGATIPIALDEANRRGDLLPDQKLVMPTVGGGMAWGALLVVWADTRATAES